MAKAKRVKPTTAGMFDATAPAPAEAGKPARGADPVQARGVGLHASEWAEIDRLAGEYGMNSHALALALLRYGLAALKAGKIKTKTQQTLDL